MLSQEQCVAPQQLALHDNRLVPGQHSDCVAERVSLGSGEDLSRRLVHGE